MAPPEKRRVGIVFQDYALFPHLTVRQNIAYGLKRRLWQTKRGARTRIDEMLELVGLTAHAEKRPHQLSGGEQQRVALARALAPAPRIILLDEPFANLDATLRAEVRDQTRQILKRCGATAVLVTHDQEEALSIADTVGVMLAGRIAQVGSPEEVYFAPATREVARLIGDGNLLEAHTEAGVGDVPAIVESQSRRLRAGGQLTANPWVFQPRIPNTGAIECTSVIQSLSPSPPATAQALRRRPGRRLGSCCPPAAAAAGGSTPTPCRMSWRVPGPGNLCRSRRC
jgi:ABC-type Fe3+/spermidine/putrescine transport system ATPase subunit